MRIGLAAAAAVMLACLGLPALADDAQVGAIAVKGAWSRATAPGAAVGAAFLTVVNGGAEDDALVAVATDVAKTVEMHSHVMDGEVMRMRKVPSVAVPAGKSIALAPGGLHIMLIGLSQPLAQGASFPLTLTFQKAGSVVVTVPIQDLGAMPAGMSHDHMH